MKKTLFTGSGVAIITPMNCDGSINFDELGKIIEFQIENGTDAIITCGTTGEAATMTPDEYAKVIKYTVDKVNKRVPVIAGSGSNNTQTALDHSLKAQSLGVDGLLIVTPYYNKASQKGLIEHYSYIADRVELPIILYNVPSRTGCNIKPETYAKLAEHPNIVGIKEASGDISALAKTISLCKDKLAVYSGNDDQIVPIMSLGGVGVISVFANICPDKCHQLTKLVLDGKFSEATKIQLEYLDLINSLFSDVNPIPIKAAMNMIGYNCGRCRMPLSEMTPEALDSLGKIISRYNLV